MLFQPLRYLADNNLLKTSDSSGSYVVVSWLQLFNLLTDGGIWLTDVQLVSYVLSLTFSCPCDHFCVFAAKLAWVVSQQYLNNSAFYLSAFS